MNVTPQFGNPMLAQNDNDKKKNLNKIMLLRMLDKLNITAIYSTSKSLQN